MTDHQREFLQASASAEFAAEEPQSGLQALSVVPQCQMGSALGCVNSAADPADVANTIAKGQPGSQAQGPPPAAVPGEKSVLHLMLKDGWQNLSRLVLAHRRQTAAGVLLICMAVLWIGEGPSMGSSPATDSATEMSNVETLLRDFDSADGHALREPAEPVDQSAQAFQFTVPFPDGDHSAEARSSPRSPSSATLAVYPEEADSSGSSAGGPWTIPDTSLHSTSGSTRDSGRRKGVRFTGQIQPLQ